MENNTLYLILSLLHIISLGVCIGWLIKLHTDKKRLTLKNNDLVDKVAFKDEMLEESLVSARKQTTELNILRDENEKLRKQINDTYDKHNPTIIRVNNIYPVKINSATYFSKMELEHIEPTLKDGLIRDRLFAAMRSSLQNYISYQELDITRYGPFDCIEITGTLEVIPNIDKE